MRERAQRSKKQHTFIVVRAENHKASPEAFVDSMSTHLNFARFGGATKNPVKSSSDHLSGTALWLASFPRLLVISRCTTHYAQSRRDRDRGVGEHQRRLVGPPKFIENNAINNAPLEQVVCKTEEKSRANT